MTSFRNPPPVEQLGDIAWKRVEQGLMAKLGAQQPAYVAPVAPERRPWMVGGAALLAAAAVALLVFGQRDGGQGASPALVHAQVSELVTQQSSTRLDLLGAQVEVAAHSAISVEQGDNRLRIDLREGAVHLKVAKRDDMREPVAVVAGDVRVEVMGTEFAVSRHEESAQVVVFEGVVRVTSKGQRTLVKAGETWPPSELAAGTAKVRTKVRAKGPRVANKLRREEPSKSIEPAASSASELFSEAQELEVSDPAQAIALYKRVSVGSGAWAANALFAHARLELGRGHQKQAETLLRHYAKRFPQGANIADVTSLLED